uniref:CSON012925 protein n=1 Tax=Culicoides sonorensis TaxID=179676 RepID=A0A336KML1_CULSO
MPNKVTMERISECTEKSKLSSTSEIDSDVTSSDSSESEEEILQSLGKKGRSNSVGIGMTYRNKQPQSFQSIVMFQAANNDHNNSNPNNNDSNETLSIPNIPSNVMVPSMPSSRRMTGTSEDVREYALRMAMVKSHNQQFSQQLMVMLQGHSYGSHTSLRSNHEVLINEIAKAANWKDEFGYRGVSTTISALYAKIIVFMGIAFPVTDVISAKTTPSFYQGFYLYLYVVSVLFVIFVYAAHYRNSVVTNVIDQYGNNVAKQEYSKRKNESRHGSFYLRVGAIAFGVGSMVYTGLEFGQYFELKEDDRCQNVLVAITPVARLLLSLVQMHFIFIYSKLCLLRNHKLLAKFGLMHLLATNLCEWLFVLIEEAKHEILHVVHHKYHLTPDLDKQNLTSIAENLEHHLSRRATGTDIFVECRRTNIMGNLVQNAAPYLFPCTIEYSLICAVILFEMWKHLCANDGESLRSQRRSHKDSHQLSINCAGSHRGMFCGILITVLTIISLIMYFVLSIETQPYQAAAVKEVTYCEILLYFLMTIAIICAVKQMNKLRYSSKRRYTTMSLDCTLLLVAQSGIYIYCMFSVIGCYFAITSDSSEDYGAAMGMFAEILCIVQTTLQTLFILHGWWKRCKGHEQRRQKPGRQFITFLLIANMSMWILNCLIKQRAGFRPTHMEVFGIWSWTILTHISMPLAIFYRFHSTICLFEIWKTTYKFKHITHTKSQTQFLHPKIKVTSA